ncbi:hypothetical protein FOVSG1_008056 [Fusarium oxysporum f. sp. vasinfectum]
MPSALSTAALLGHESITEHIILALLGLRNDADIEPSRQRILADSQPSRLPEYTSRIMSSSLRSTNWAKNFGLSIAHQHCSATGH